MKILLLADVPPCYQYTGGIVLNSLVNFLPAEQVAICTVINPLLKPEIPTTLDTIPRLLLEKPNEFAFKAYPGFWGGISAFAVELFRGLTVRYKLLPQIVNFAKQQQIDALWVLLEGQTMVRLARRLSKALDIPLFTQVHDPFELWLRAHHIDRLTQRRLLAEFDKAVSHSTACATASWAMSQLYTKKYGVKNNPVISGLSNELARPFALIPHEREEFIIGIAGQIYAEHEWYCLIQALNQTNWTIANRRIRVRVLSGVFQSYSKNPVNFEYLGWQSQEDTLRLLAECDLLYLPYWFSEEFRGETTYCFPSKLVTYFASGRPVLCHAPDYASPAKYIVQNDAGYVCSSLDPQVVSTLIEQIMIDTHAYARVTKNGTTCFLRDFTLERMRESFFKFIGFKDKTLKLLESSFPKVSIIIPVYNGANYLNLAIDSALAQTYQNIEIVVINDGSEDNGATEAIAHSYGDRIRYFSKPNGGVASALNMGICQMTGDYFSWLSHDDLYLPDKIEKQIKALSEIKSDKVILYGDYSVFTTDPNKDVLWAMKGVPPSEFRYWITVENCLHGCTLLIPKSAFEECGIFNESLCTTQDYDLWFRIAKKYQFIHQSTHLVKSRSHSQQGSIQMKDIALKECNNLLSNFIRQLSMVELQQATYCSPGLGYAQLTSSMWYRGFFSAGLTSACLSIKPSFKGPLKEIILGQCIISKGLLMHYIAKPMRKFIPPYMRLIIQKSLKSVSTLIRPSPPAQKNDAYTALEEMDLKQKFTIVYKDNMFQGRNSRSGEGSDLIQTAIIRNEIPKLIEELTIHSMLDAPCGDWYWMSHLKLNVDQYFGVDIVEQLIEKNQKTFGSEKISFACKNLVTDSLPKAELILSRDCFVHLSDSDIFKILQNFHKSGAKYLLTTTFTDRELNIDLGEGFWRPINLQQAPFNFPPPLRIMNEGCTEGDNLFTDKALGLWRLEDISNILSQAK